MEDRWTDRLSEYLDGELGATDHAELEQHLSGCAACAASLDELRTVVARLAHLPEAGPTHDLWPGIAARLDAARSPVAVDDGIISLAAHRRRFSFTLPQLAAAGIAVIALSSGLAWWVANGGGRFGGASHVAVVTPAGQATAAAPVTTSPASAATQVPPATAPAAAQPGVPAGGSSLAAAAPNGSAEPTSAARRTHLVSAPLTGRARADRDYDRAVGELETVLRHERSRLRPETVAALQKSLADIDRALADARRALARDPGNVYLNAHLAETMQLKLEVLRTAASLTQS